MVLIVHKGLFFPRNSRRDAGRAASLPQPSPTPSAQTASFINYIRRKTALSSLCISSCQRSQRAPTGPHITQAERPGGDAPLLCVMAGFGLATCVPAKGRITPQCSWALFLALSMHTLTQLRTLVGLESESIKSSYRAFEGAIREAKPEA